MYDRQKIILIDEVRLDIFLKKEKETLGKLKITSYPHAFKCTKEDFANNIC